MLGLAMEIVEVCLTRSNTKCQLTDLFLRALRPTGNFYFSNISYYRQGPLYDSENEVVVGIVSWGLEGCDNPAFPSVFARMSVMVRVWKQLLLGLIYRSVVFCIAQHSPTNIVPAVDYYD